jgi:hypothetical protein
MPSTALNTWRTVRRAALDQMERAHAGLGGSGPGRRHDTAHLNQAYVVLLSSHFQAMTGTSPW